MSFGYSIGDFIAVGQLAWQVYKSCKDAPEGFKNVSQEVLSLHAVLKEAEETLSGHPLSQSQESSLAIITSGCQDVLKDLQTLVLRYESLGSKTKRTWDRLRWHSNDIAELRARLTSNTVLLTAYMSTSQFVVERQLNKFMQEFRDGKHEPSVVTTQTIESLSTDEKEKWRNIRKELENIGISVAAFDANKVFILEWFKEASITGAFEEQTLEDDSNSISYSNHSRQSLEDPNSTTSEYVTQQVPSPSSKDAGCLDSNQPRTKITTTEILQSSVSSVPQISSKDLREVTPRISPTATTQKIRPPRVAAMTIQGRSQSTMDGSSSAPNDLSREGSEILNQVVISKPEVDFERDREREWIDEAIIPLKVISSEVVNDEGRGGSWSKHDNTATSSKRENTKFGDYFLGNTLGEERFGKVKMGWKQEGGVQVAIKLIRRPGVSTEPTRLANIYREIAILREISHPNIIRLLEKVETEKHIGIVIEYAPGGELFDYIVYRQYLKDITAKKIFAQLLSGVGYLHQKGIVHRDLKLENIWLDQNCNIIISDFGCANTFNPNNELREEIEYNQASCEYDKMIGPDKVLPNRLRRGDFMETSCGSPYYAAPEIVVSNSLYAGRKVDVWSCGVILYAMLAGYLPFDDDPTNPEGENINLLYKYILSAPLTFPEYVTPHSRELLQGILVPDPRMRPDLVQVAKHSWLSRYADVVGFIASSTTITGDIASATVSMGDHAEVPLVVRSTSVRMPTKHAADEIIQIDLYRGS